MKKKIGDFSKTKKLYKGVKKYASIKKSNVKSYLAERKAKRDLNRKIKNLNHENESLKRELKRLKRSTNQELLSYMVVLQNIYSNVKFDDSNQDLKFIRTQLDNFLMSKGYVIFIPELGKQHNKEEMIVGELIEKDDVDGNVDSIIALGIKNSEGKIIIPARVRVIKGVVKNAK